MGGGGARRRGAIRLQPRLEEKTLGKEGGQGCGERELYMYVVEIIYGRV